MPIQPGDSAAGRALARRGGQVRRQRRVMLLADVERELGELQTPADAQRWLRQAYVWAAAGMIPGTVANGLVRAVEVWLKAYDVRQVSGRIRELERQIAAAEPGKRVRAL